jgi:hypothetical protein
MLEIETARRSYILALRGRGETHLVYRLFPDRKIVARDTDVAAHPSPSQRNLVPLDYRLRPRLVIGSEGTRYIYPEYYGIFGEPRNRSRKKSGPIADDEVTENHDILLRGSFRFLMTYPLNYPALVTLNAASDAIHTAEDVISTVIEAYTQVFDIENASDDKPFGIHGYQVGHLWIKGIDVVRLQSGEFTLDLDVET